MANISSLCFLCLIKPWRELVRTPAPFFRGRVKTGSQRPPLPRFQSPTLFSGAFVDDDSDGVSDGNIGSGTGALDLSSSFSLSILFQTIMLFNVVLAQEWNKASTLLVQGRLFGLFDSQNAAFPFCLIKSVDTFSFLQMCKQKNHKWKW